MAKTDKELAVDVLCAYLRAGYGPPAKAARDESTSGFSIFLTAAYDAIHRLPDDERPRDDTRL